MTEGEIGRLVTLRIISASSSRKQREKTHVLGLCSQHGLFLLARGQTANLCNFRDNLLTWRALLPLSAVDKWTCHDSLTHTHRAEPKCIHTLPGCSVSSWNQSQAALMYVNHTGQVGGHFPDRSCSTSVNLCYPLPLLYTLFSLSMQSEQGYTNQHKPAVVLILLPQHQRRSAMHSQRCTWCTSFAWVHRDDF